MARPAERIVLSILILTLPERRRGFDRLVSKLEAQAGERPEVEILALLDNRSLTIAEKRNALLAMARGTHLTFVDDDDDVAPDYVEQILGALSKEPALDVLCFHQVFRINGKPGRVLSGMAHEDMPVLRVHSRWRYADLRRKPFHWCVWRRELAQSERFREQRVMENGQSAEDIDWLRRLYPKVATHGTLDAFLHFYRFDDRGTRSMAAVTGLSLRERLVRFVRAWQPTGWLQRLPR